MSTTEDCELQDLVKQTLEKTGALSKIRAELRAGVFLALNENDCSEDTDPRDRELQNFSENDDGALLLNLVKEFLDTFGLSFTMSVLDPELASYKVQCTWKNRTELVDHLDLSSDLDNDGKKPLLYHILQRFRNQQKYARNPPSQVSVNEEESVRKYSDPSLDCTDSPVKTLSKGTVICVTSDEETAQLERSSRISHQVNDVEWKESRTSTTNNVNKESFVADLHKPNSCLLGDLPPLSPPATVGKVNVSSSSKSTNQLSKLKAMLIDSSHDTSNSPIMNHELTNLIGSGDYSDSGDFNGNQMKELLK